MVELQQIDKQLKEYIKENIFPIYENNDSGHGIEHIEYVIKRSLNFARQFKNIDLNMVYTIASFHDIAHHADRNVDIVSSLKRTHSYTIKHYPNLDLDQMITRAYKHISKKFGNCGYAKVWLVDEEFDKFKDDVKELLKDKYIFGG